MNYFILIVIIIAPFLSRAEPSNNNEEFQRVWDSRNSERIFSKLFFSDQFSIRRKAQFNFESLEDSPLKQEISILILRYWEDFEEKAKQGIPEANGAIRNLSLKINALKCLSFFLEKPDLLKIPIDDSVYLGQVAQEAEDKLGRILKFKKPLSDAEKKRSALRDQKHQDQEGVEQQKNETPYSGSSSSDKESSQNLDSNSGSQILIWFLVVTASLLAFFLRIWMKRKRATS